MTTKDNIHVLSRAVIIDQGHILLCKTCDLKTNFYYLLGGHVEHGESAKESILRELMEEANVKCTVKKVLGCLEYSVGPELASKCHSHSYNFIFEIESDSLKINMPLNQVESKRDILWMPLDKLPEIDFRPEPLKKLIPYWINAINPDFFQSDIKS